MARLMLGLVVLLLAGCASAEVREGVVIQAPNVQLFAPYAIPAGPMVAPAVVALHGCGGPFAARDGQWQDLLVAAGHPVLLPDSFGSRGLGSQCSNPSRSISPGGGRRTDAVAAARWLFLQPSTPAGGVVVMGWSNGGSTVLAAAAEGVMPEGLVRGFVAFYPGCRAYAERADWTPSAPMLIVMGDADDWTPAAPCRALAARFPDRIKLVLFPGAYHDFDVPDRPVRIRRGRPSPQAGTERRMSGPTRPLVRLSYARCRRGSPACRRHSLDFGPGLGETQRRRFPDWSRAFAG